MRERDLHKCENPARTKVGVTSKKLNRAHNIKLVDKSRVTPRVCSAPAHVRP